MLVSQAISIVQDSLGDQGGIYFKSNIILAYLNEGVRDIFTHSSVGRDKAVDAILAPDVNTYSTVGEDLIKVHYIYDKDGKCKLEEVLFESLIDQMGVDYVTSKEVPRYFYKGFNAGQTVIKFVPTPIVQFNFTISYTAYPIDLTLVADTETVIPGVYTDDVIRFAIMRCHERSKDFQAANHAQLQYVGNLFHRRGDSQKLDDNYWTISPDEMDFL